MKRQEMLAIIFLVIAIVLSLASILVNASIDARESDNQTNVQENTTVSKGTIQLIIERPSGGKNEG